jgi:hypothetical protein
MHASYANPSCLVQDFAFGSKSTLCRTAAFLLRRDKTPHFAITVSALVAEA